MRDYNVEGLYAFKGIVDLDVRNTKNKVTRHLYNTITVGGKRLLLDKSAGSLLKLSASPFGEMYCLGGSMISDMQGYSSIGLTRYIDDGSCMTLALLNIPENVTLSDKSTFAPLWDNSGASLAVGYANNNIVPKVDGREGKIISVKPDYLKDFNTVAQRWFFEPGVATGTFNHIAFIPAASLKNIRGLGGVKVSKCLDDVNTQYTNFTSLATGFLPPGVPGYTSNSEILLNFERDGISRWKYNIETGEMTEVPAENNFFCIEFFKDKFEDYFVEGGYLYVLRGMINTYASDVGKVYVYDIANGMNKVKEFYVSASSGYTPAHCQKFFRHGGKVYVSTWNSSTDSTLESNADSASCLIEIVKGSNAYYSGLGVKLNNFDSLGISLPAGLLKSYVGLGNYGDNYVIFIGGLQTEMHASDSVNRTASISGQYFGYKSTAYVVTNLSDIFGSLLDVIPQVTPNEVFFAAGVNKGTLRMGFDAYCSNTQSYNSSGEYCGPDGIHRRIYNNSPTFTTSASSNNNDQIKGRNTTLSVNNQGVFFTPDGSWSSLISFVNLGENIVKNDDTEVTVSYGYQIV